MGAFAFVKASLIFVEADDVVEGAEADDVVEGAEADDDVEGAEADDDVEEAEADDDVEEAEADDVVEGAEADDDDEEAESRPLVVRSPIVIPVPFGTIPSTKSREVESDESYQFNNFFASSALTPSNRTSFSLSTRWLVHALGM